MCGIAALLGGGGGPAVDLDGLRAALRRRGPDAFAEEAPLDGGLRLLGAVLHLRGPRVTPQPLVDAESGDALACGGGADDLIGDVDLHELEAILWGDATPGA